MWLGLGCAGAGRYGAGAGVVVTGAGFVSPVRDLSVAVAGAPLALHRIGVCSWSRCRTGSARCARDGSKDSGAFDGVAVAAAATCRSVASCEAVASGAFVKASVGLESGFAGEGNTNESAHIASAGRLTPAVRLDASKGQDVPNSFSFKATIKGSEMPEASGERQSEERRFVNQNLDRGRAMNGRPKKEGFVAVLKCFPGGQIYPGAFTLGVQKRKERIRESEVEAPSPRMKRYV